MYSQFKKHLRKSIKMVPVELAGRGKRFEEPFYESMEDAINDVYEIIGDEFEKSRYALLGYSMGSWLTYGLYKKIVQNHRRQPEHLFLAAKEPPHVQIDAKIVHKLDDENFMKEIFHMGGTSEKLLENKEWLDLFLPILRADYRITEMYKESSLKEKLNCPVTVFAGEDDEINVKDIKRWDEITNHDFSFYTFAGGHLFIQNNVEGICDIINDTFHSGSLAL
ncbi:thioesterase [Acetonema longum DSM 6540]|uniref:Thioesterase n=2 Tax=Acetonema TaxID=2373 RepID=F7NN41_9FIRM|nr:thioesterase [Acetonema longum DSM 6540]